MRDFNARRLLFDTNILLDAVCSTRPESQEACEVLRLCNGGDMGLACATSLKDVYYVLERIYDEPRARQAVAWLMELLVVAPIGAEECMLALQLDEPDVEDAMVHACAELNEVDVILTRDANAFHHARPRVMTCAEYLDYRAQ